jgi:hypothetical protein
VARPQSLQQSANWLAQVDMTRWLKLKALALWVAVAAVWVAVVALAQ